MAEYTYMSVRLHKTECIILKKLIRKHGFRSFGKFIKTVVNTHLTEQFKVSWQLSDRRPGRPRGRVERQEWTLKQLMESRKT